MTPARKAWWFNRFQLRPAPGDVLHFRDRLFLQGRTLPAAMFGALGGRALEIAFFQYGFIPAAASSALATVADRPQHAADALYWQFPCRTEAAAWDLHAGLAHPLLSDGALHIYLGLPWATWIDRKRADPDLVRAHNEMTMQRIRIGGFRRALAELGVGLRVHTVCQHVYWRELLPTWRDIGITDAWLSHAPDSPSEAGAPEVMLHPWRLFAVNVEDPARRSGLMLARDPATKPLLASFIGAHAGHYISDVRLRLGALASEPGFHVETTTGWHFEGVVYGHQVKQQPLAESYRIDDSVTHYNRMLSDSVFSLCPAGAGPNTLRLWESLAVGAVPVLLGPPPRLPEGGTLARIDWDAIVLRVADDEIGQLPRMLRAMPMEEVRARQRLGMQAFEQVRLQCCF